MAQRVFRSFTCNLSVAASAAALLALTVIPGFAQAPRQNEPGQFDFYVLSLSWSPSFCDAVTERSAESAARQPECGDKPYAFVVRGLWPQYEKGFPEYCQNPAPRLARNAVRSTTNRRPRHAWNLGVRTR